LKQHSRAITQVLPKTSKQIALHVGSPNYWLSCDGWLDPSKLVSQYRTNAQLGEHGSCSFVLARTARKQLCVTILHLLSRLFVDRRLACSLKLQLRQSLSDFRFPIRHSRSTPLGLSYANERRE